MTGLRQPGVPAALGAALLFGAGPPLAKLLLDDAGPWLLAGLLYLVAGSGLRVPPLRERREDIRWMAKRFGKAAEALSISRKTLWEKMRKHSIADRTKGAVS